MGLLKSLLFFLFFGFTVHVTNTQKTVCKEANIADIVLLVDGSWSIGTENFKSMQDFLYTLINGFDVGQDKIRIGLIQYSDEPRTEFYLNSYNRKDDILQYVRTLKYKGGGTKTGESLEFMLDNHFTESAGGRANNGVPQIAVVITDGQSQDNIKEPSRRVKEAGITLYAIGIKDALLTELNEIASDPDEKYVYNVADFTALQGISQNMLQVLCTTVEEATRQMSQIAQGCRKANQADIVFLVESSTRIKETAFQNVKYFLHGFVSSLDVGITKVRIGLAQYSDETDTVFLLNEYSTKSEILERIQSLSYKRGTAYTGRALDIVSSRFFTESAGSRAAENIAQILVVVTSGKPADEVKQPARKLKSRGISVYVTGPNIKDIFEVQELASKPSRKFIYPQESFDAAEDVTAKLLSNICSNIVTKIQASSKRYADIVFLVDSSSSIGTAVFQQIKAFITRIIEQLDVGINKYRVGLAQYSGTAQTEFLLNTHDTKQQVTGHVKNITFRGGPLNTGSALDYLHTTFYVEEAGSRINQGLPQFAVIITSAKSQDIVTTHAQQLKSIGVTTIAVGIRNSEREELEEIATDPFVFQLSDLRGIGDVEQEVVNAVATQEMLQFAVIPNAPAVCSSASLADIVFVIDESSGIGNTNFQLTRVFLHKVINSLEIGFNKVRVGLVLYSDQPNLEFKLDTFKEKYEILDYITKLPYRGGEAHTGAALNFVRKELFSQENGGRAHQGVQQIAVVMTSGQSKDNSTKPAAKLRRRGVEVFAVGFQNANKTELKSIASYPPRKHVTNVKSFLQLSNIELRLKKLLCQEIIVHSFSVPALARTIKDGCVDTEEADIYFLIDGSGSIYPEDFEDMKNFMTEVVGMFQIGPNRVRFGVVQYSDNPRVEFTINMFTAQKTLKEAIKQIYQLGGGTQTGKALQSMKSLFATAESERPNKVPQSLIVITDGESQDQVTEAAAEIRGEGITVYAIGVKNAIQQQLEDIAGSKDKMFFVDNFDSLDVIKHELTRDLCTPEACKNMRADILFLTDSSGSINNNDYERMKEFMNSLVKQSDIGPDKVQIGLIQFSSETREEFPLNKYTKKHEIQDAISSMQKLDQGTLTGAALQNALPYFSSARGGRSKTKQYLIIITDGESSDPVAKPAAAIRSKGVDIYAIGVLDANNTQLLEIAGKQDRVFLEESFDALAFLNKQIMFEICSPEDSCKRTEVADIIFLVDASASITVSQFKIMQRFMEAVVNDSVVGKENVQFGVVTYATTPAEKFSLNAYSTKPEVRKAIHDLKRLKGLTYTATALEYTQQRFNTIYGGRLGVTRIIILITDGATTAEDRPKLDTVPQSLRDNGTIIFAVGVGGAKREELEKIAGQPNRWFLVDNYNSLEGLHENITHIVCDQSKPACAHQQLDLVFLIDGSASITPSDFETSKVFMKEIVDSFTIAENRVRIGVAQYSEGPQKEFFLNEHYSSSKMKDHIDQIVQLNQNTYTGKGLKFVKQFFDPVNGSRKNQNVPQYLIVMTDGESHDTVDEEAAELRNNGIKIFSIGIGLKNSFELIQIAGNPNNVFLVENFNVLDSIKRKIVSQVCEQTDEPSKDCSIDITVSVDYSKRITPSTTSVLQKKLNRFLPEVLQHISTMSNLSCTSGSPLNIQFRYAVPRQDFTFHFESDFEKYNEDILRKFIEVQSTVDSFLNVQFLEALWRKMKTLPEQKTKIILIFTDGLDDSITALKKTSESLRRQGLDGLLLVGLEGVPNLKELQKLEFGRGFSYEQPLSIGIYDLPSIMLKEIDTVAERKCCKVICKCLGQAGTRGLPGPPGSKGRFGEKGSQGHPGEEGGTGDRGPHGLNGTRGEDGCPGARGLKGARGFRGDKGDDGENGIDGVPGEQGEHGTSGLTGESGSPGSQGKKGPRGESGERGEPGFRGDLGEPGINDNVPGPKGRKGNQGRQGEPGQDGVQGETGDDSPEGPQGRRGPPGSKGEQGIPGQQGNPGENGLQGIQGPKGLSGPPGSRGEKGLPGPQGSTVSKTMRRTGKATQAPKPLKGASSQPTRSLPELFRTQPPERHVERETPSSPEGYSPHSSLSRESLPEHPSHQDLIALMGQMPCMSDLHSIAADIKATLTAALSELKADLHSVANRLHEVEETTLKRSHLMHIAHNTRLLEISIPNLLKAFNEFAILSSFKINFSKSAALNISLPDESVQFCKTNFPFTWAHSAITYLGIELPTDLLNLYPLNFATLITRVRNDLKEWTKLRYSWFDLSSNLGPLTPIRMNPAFPPGQHSAFLARWSPDKSPTANLFFDRQGKFRTLSDLNANSQANPMPLWTYFQIRHYLTAHNIRPRVIRPLSHFDKLCNSHGRITHLIFETYGLLSDSPSQPSPASEAWNRDLSISLSPQDWEKMDNLLLKGSSNVQIQETNYKIQSRWYKTPEGTPGVVGAPGAPGSQGSQGQKGEPGDIGEKGDTGVSGGRGLPGVDGIDGYGAPGKKGERGHLGFPGYPGPQGDDGDPGTPGGRGPKGSRGRRGNSGGSGENGGPGERGPPGPGGSKGPPGPVSFTTCELVQFTKENCPCFSGPSKCPVYPTEVVFALDSSQDVPPAGFQRMKNIIISLIENMEISESNCPKGARVAVVTYSNTVKHLIRFSDFKNKNRLLEEIRKIPLERTTAPRNIGEAMRFVGRNMFKRIRYGVLMRKVAFFFANGKSQDATSINTAVLELGALNIAPAVIAFDDVPNVKTAFAVEGLESAGGKVGFLKKDIRGRCGEVRAIFLFKTSQMRSEKEVMGFSGEGLRLG
ncbi:PREDICTED: collagen alpha-6(VI) chain-like [Nanorana parkeri]|uniref:collagen alpha-6(VI) chain-like n=1 Tax=Nanorana parkeri TaxID=125878 RepID=UPI000854D03E|nr:PREDICTED: collagen alpha-6(VI) chain-like [Nanorana parkeri]